ncbi:MAG: hypothetical protein MJ211_02855 [Bacteroidales bacterium]|nr:hypothetical protein [Bacteroidales bacterium]
MLILVGFVGFICQFFSKSSQRLEGCLITNYSGLNSAINKNENACLVADILSDDEIIMPDSNQRIIKGALSLVVKWPDNSENVLINWNGCAKFIKIKCDDTLLNAVISPENIDCIVDEYINPQNVRVVTEGNKIKINYCHKSFSLMGRVVKGDPTIVIRREYINFDTKVAAIFEKSKNGYLADCDYKISNIVAYETANQRKEIITIYGYVFIAFIVLGGLLFFVPEKKYKG